MKSLVESLLEQWCNGLLKLQTSNLQDSEQNGAIYCQACNCIHGRCFEAMYPFLYMAQKSKDKKWVTAAENLFLWAQANLSQPDGSYINDKNCDWKGTTVFNTIALADCIIHHNTILPKSLKQNILKRIEKAAEFLYSCEEINHNNINYPISNALALYECGLVLNKNKYAAKAEKLALLANKVITKNGLIFGEGTPRFEKSAKGCNSVDIGYNIEETLPSLALYGLLSKNIQALNTAEKGLMSHLSFMASDGAWNNSFGTRNFKWAYWGSRTSDGCALGYLLFAKTYPEFALAAYKNIKLMQECTDDGLLAAGPHYNHAKQLPCVHHTFTHAKVLAAILDRELCNEALPNLTLPIQQFDKVQYYPEINTYLVNKKAMFATVTAYDWEYNKGGHISGGTLSFLHHLSAGTLLCASTSDYILHEPHNMQTPVNVLHECLALRIESNESALYSSVYETNAKICSDGQLISASGYLKNIKGEQLLSKNLQYSFKYRLEENAAFIKAEFKNGVLICPIISHKNENISLSEDKKELTILKQHCKVKVLFSCAIELPYNDERIFNLAPGLQALRINIKPYKGIAELTVKVVEL